jgi:hypothetical protein
MDFRTVRRDAGYPSHAHIRRRGGADAAMHAAVPAVATKSGVTGVTKQQGRIPAPTGIRPDA